MRCREKEYKRKRGDPTPVSATKRGRKQKEESKSRRMCDEHLDLSNDSDLEDPARRKEVEEGQVSQTY